MRLRLDTNPEICRIRRATNLATYLPDLAPHIPELGTHLSDIAAHLPI
jgi:hypothetical protein